MKLASLALAAPLLVGCPGVATFAQSSFRTEFFCPMERITVRTRTDLHPHDFACSTPASIRDLPPRMAWDHATAPPNESLSPDGISCGPPPDGFRDDPGRHALLVAAYRGAIDRFDESHGEIYEIDGCGFRRFQSCSTFLPFNPLPSCHPLGEEDPHAQR